MSGDTLEELMNTGKVFEPVETARIGVDLCRAASVSEWASRSHPKVSAGSVIRDADGRVALVDPERHWQAPGDGGSNAAALALYAAPEVLAGEAATPQSDVYSVGVLLFYLLTRAFPVDVDAVRREQHIEAWDAREDLRSSGAVPLPLASVIERALDPRREVRHSTIDALCRDLEGALDALLDGRSAANRLLRSGAVLLFVLTFAALGWTIARPPLVHQAVAVRFEGVDGAGDDNAVIDGATVEVTRLLARIRGVDVRAAIPSSAYRHRWHDVVAFGAQRQADLVLTGTVHRDAGAWRAIEIALVRVSDGDAVWSESFPIADGDLLAVHERIATALSRELKLSFSPERRYSISAALQERFLRARALQATPSDVSRRQAADMFERIATEDPAFVPALAALATTVGGVRSDSPDLPVLDPRMAAAAQRAYEKAPDLAEPNAAMALLSAHQCKWSHARQYFTTAIALDASATSARVGYAVSTLLPLGKTRDALAVLRAALDADPMSIGVRNALAHVLVENGDYDLAIETTRDLVKEAPELESAAQTLSRALYLSGRLEQPLDAFSREAQWAYRGYILAVNGRRDEAMRLAESHPREVARQMLVYAGLRDRDRTFDALQRTARLSPWRALTWMRRPEIAPVFRGDSRATAVRDRLLKPPAEAGCTDTREPTSSVSTYLSSASDATRRLTESASGPAESAAR